MGAAWRGVSLHTLFTSRWDLEIHQFALEMFRASAFEHAQRWGFQTPDDTAADEHAGSAAKPYRRRRRRRRQKKDTPADIFFFPTQAGQGGLERRGDKGRPSAEGVVVCPSPCLHVSFRGRLGNHLFAYLSAEAIAAQNGWGGVRHSL